MVSSPESGDKTTRATPLIAQINAGNVRLLEGGTWQKEFKEELSMFPGGRHDDQMDAASRAFGELIDNTAPTRRTSYQRSMIRGR
ncbi:Terminase-like family protein [compost metagenome]